MKMDELVKRIDRLSSNKRQLLYALLHRDGHTAQELPIPRINKGSTCHLSYAQQRLWFLDQLQPGNAFYNIPQVIRLQGAVDVGVLERSLNAIVQRHEALRTIFKSEEGIAHQVILPELKL